MNLLFASLISFFAGWTLAASEMLFREENRPGIFAGRPGTVLLLGMTGVAALFATGGILWMFQAVKSSGVLVIILTGGWFGFAASNRLHGNAAGAVNRLIVGVTALVIFYGLTWSVLRPTPVVDF